MVKNKTVGISIPLGEEWIVEAIKAKAKSSDRTFSNYVKGLIVADLKAAGQWPVNQLNDAPNSSKIQAAADLHSDLSNYKIRKPRKPARE